MSEQGWLQLANLILTAFGSAFAIYISYKVAQMKKGQDKAAVQVEKVAQDLEEVRHATNSLTDRLVETTEAEALGRGASQERARADAEKKS